VSGDLQEKLDDLRQRFADRAPAQAAQLRAAVEAGDVEAVAALAHKLAGIAGMVGYPQIGEASLDVEERVIDGKDAGEAVRRLLALLEGV
jgi:HPt (histidine-containing phosphotransfer) domain-containing protein